MNILRILLLGLVLIPLTACDDGGEGKARTGRLQFEWSYEGNAQPGWEFVTESVGPAHCNWGEARFLFLSQEHEYIRDPEGVLERADLNAALDLDATLPADAVDTGYRSRGRELWRSLTGEFVYIVEDGAVEGWPRAEPQVLCM